MSYNNSVLVGNWSEERLKNDFEFKLFLRRRCRQELLLQKSRNLFSNLLKERPLAVSGKFVLYGYNVQVVASDMPGTIINNNSPHVRQSLNFPRESVVLAENARWRHMYLKIGKLSLKITNIYKKNMSQIANYVIGVVLATKVGEKEQYGLALSSLVTEREVDYMQNIGDGCLVTLSPITTPCCRNTFLILSTRDESLRGEKINYGDEFLLRAENYGEPDAAPLYVRYTPEATPGPADRMPIRLSAIKDSNCRWTTVPLLPRDRLEGLGSPVETNARLLLKNCVADKCMCVMNQCWMMTFFGPECGVTCRNYIDIHKRHTAENIFTLVSNIEAKMKK